MWGVRRVQLLRCETRLALCFVRIHTLYRKRNPERLAVAAKSGLLLSLHVGTRIERRIPPKTAPAPTPPRAVTDLARRKPASTMSRAGLQCACPLRWPWF